MREKLQTLGIPFTHRSTMNEQVLTDNPTEYFLLVVPGPKNKKVLWVTGDGKLHVDPDAPADETARTVCRALEGIILHPRVFP